MKQNMPDFEKIFICPGAQKAGTTTLYDLLKQHPDIALTRTKETKYFLRDISRLNGQEYFDNFFEKDAEKSEIFGEIDPEYLYYPDVPGKIREILGSDVKFIFMLRNPVNRSYSHYWMSRQRGFETESFERAFELEPSRLDEGGEFAAWHQSYFSRGLYAEQLDRYLDSFPRENMLFVLFEDFVQNPREGLRAILQFLGVNESLDSIDVDKKSREGRKPRSEFLARLHGQPMGIKKIMKVLIPFKQFRWKIYPIIEKLNVSKNRPEMMSEKMQKKLTEYYCKDVRRLSLMTGLDLSSWVV